MAEAPLTRRQLRIGDANALMQSGEALPSVIAAPVASDAAVPAPVVPATRRSSKVAARSEAVVLPVAPHRSRRRTPIDVPAVPVPQEPVAHVSLETVMTAPIAIAPAAMPVADEPVVDEVAPESAAPEEPVDLFAEAARALNFTGETPVASDEPRPAAPAAPRVGAHHSARRARPSAARRVATVTASLGAFGVVGLMAVGMTTPFAALASTESVDVREMSIAAGPAEDTDEQIQAFVAPAEVQNAEVQGSGGYETTTFAEMAAVTGINTANAFYVNDPTADIQWPIVLGTSKSYSFGQRWGRLHEGIDFTPGAGAPVQAIAAGTVRIATESGGAYGVNVYIDHVIDGQLITSHYAHMQYGSLKVSAGDEVEVGDTLGLVGNTGRSFGAHLHFELRLPSGQAIDPMPWLEEHAGTHYTEEQAAEVAGAPAEDAGE
ncbi:M23 family metallopeptidase [Microbacterium sp. JZ31]|uniref:M23 family metallopeptidase n=1 Tax=Microbacterium sp. JZ31 TaxID=1906274 RepID=UPI001934B647|nr:M23 family metallopeptidase [Microbacterium sp. JZ31]